MDEESFLASRFEASRPHLQRVAYRMLGSRAEADDAVQEAWLKLSRTGADGIDNLGGWLTTVVARVSLDMLRSRKSRREDPFEPDAAEPMVEGGGPEQDLLLGDAVGVALLVVLQMLDPAERVAFVLHDMFDLPFDEIAPIVGRSSAAARQLASRARRRVQGPPRLDVDLASQRRVVDAYLAASRSGDVQALLAVLDPDVVLHADAASTGGQPLQVRGAQVVSQRALAGARGQVAQLVLINGTIGIVAAPLGRPTVLVFRIEGGRVAEIEVIADAERLAGLDLVVLD
ncbi:sigma-70 family RNA polymerase sigma factor [Devosia ginsengisoli]|uniref:sigma-70 family RNA polymerase sigma factor n=1 Tax=Devosia ginsengisoli TaxID=400770 RepID=UPI0026EB89CD|nr:sigma-70 family RNA polymerase sigma factor [Devosia ginsengisoli]MCR6671760.1 sigma-70 family RNA polymerase sigma factor [Devosia ginsengisoli]